MILDEFKYKLTKEKQLIYQVAYNILSDEALSEQAAMEAQAACEQGRWTRTLLEPSIMAVILAKEAAFRLYKKKPDARPFRTDCWTYVKPNQKPPKFEALDETDALMLCLGLEKLDSLLLCEEGGLTVKEAAFLLSLPEEETRTRYEEARLMLAELLTPEEEGEHPPVTESELSRAVHSMCERILAHLPNKLPSSAEVSKREWIVAAAGFAFVDVAAILLAVGVIGWCGGFIKNPPPPESPGYSGTSQSEDSKGPRAEGQSNAPEDSLNALYYRLEELPEGFRRVEHLRSATSSKVYYADEAGGSIAFSQQLSEESVEGFSAKSGDYETVEFRGHPAAYREREGLREVYWYNGSYCYTLTATLSREETLRLAQSAGIGAPGEETLQKIPLESLPESYTPRLAQENGDVLLGATGPAFTEKITAFYEAAAQGKESALRITEFKKNDAACITDLEARDGRVYYTRDEHRDTESDQPWEAGTAYDRAVLREENGVKTLLLESAQWEEPLTVAAY